MKKQTRVYNVILPVWLLVLFPQLLIFVIPGNLLVDCAVLSLTLLALKHTQKAAVMKRLWWKFWLLGFAADAVGVAWMFFGAMLAIPSRISGRTPCAISCTTPSAIRRPSFGRWPGWPWPACASISSTNGPCAPASCSPGGRGT